MKILAKIRDYILLKKSPAGTGINLRLMHGINKISLLMFLVAMIILAIRLFG